MPTPFYHLSVAEDLFRHPDLSSGALDLLGQYRAEFLLGNTAPNFQIYHPRIYTPTAKARWKKISHYCGHTWMAGKCLDIGQKLGAGFLRRHSR